MIFAHICLYRKTGILGNPASLLFQCFLMPTAIKKFKKTNEWVLRKRVLSVNIKNTLLNTALIFWYCLQSHNSSHKAERLRRLPVVASTIHRNIYTGKLCKNRRDALRT